MPPPAHENPPPQSGPAAAARRRRSPLSSTPPNSQSVYCGMSRQSATAYVRPGIPACSSFNFSMTFRAMSIWRGGGGGHAVFGGGRGVSSKGIARGVKLWGVARQCRQAGSVRFARWGWRGAAACMQSPSAHAPARRPLSRWSPSTRCAPCPPVCLTSRSRSAARGAAWPERRAARAAARQSRGTTQTAGARGRSAPPSTRPPRRAPGGIARPAPAPGAGRARGRARGPATRPRWSPCVWLLCGAVWCTSLPVAGAAVRGGGLAAGSERLYLETQCVDKIQHCPPSQGHCCAQNCINRNRPRASPVALLAVKPMKCEA
jgi:hypothetical protein